MITCPSCDAQQADASKFCSECGAALGPAIEATVTYVIGCTFAVIAVVAWAGYGFYTSAGGRSRFITAPAKP